MNDLVLEYMPMCEQNKITLMHLTVEMVLLIIDILSALHFNLISIICYEARPLADPEYF